MHYGRSVPDRVLNQQIQRLYANAMPANLAVATIGIRSPSHFGTIWTGCNNSAGHWFCLLQGPLALIFIQL